MDSKNAEPCGKTEMADGTLLPLISTGTDPDTRGKLELEVITVKISRFEKLDDCTATMLNKKSGKWETVRLCILIKSANQYTDAAHGKWKKILEVGTQLELELLLDLKFQLVVYLSKPTETEFLELYHFMVAIGEVDNSGDKDDDDNLCEHSHSPLENEGGRIPKFPLYDEKIVEFKLETPCFRRIGPDSSRALGS